MTEIADMVLNEPQEAQLIGVECPTIPRRWDFAVKKYQSFLMKMTVKGL